MKSDNPDKSFLVDGQYAIEDLVDLNQLRQLFEQFTRATGFTIGFLDHPGLNILIGTGWRDICTKYHRMCTLAAANCEKSNHHLLDQLDEPGKLAIEACDNGLVDCATPIIIQGKHIASLATGQLLLQEPDLDRFKRQARLFGFDEAEYLKALAEIPVVDEEKLKAVTAFLGEMALVISQIGYTRSLVQEETERMAIEIAERKHAEEALRESEATYRFLTDKMNDMIWMANLDFNLTYISPSVKKILGFTPEERLRQTPEEMMTPETISHAFTVLNRELERELKEGVNPERTVKLELDFYHRNGSLVSMESVMSAIRGHDGKITGIHGVSRDITERKRAEEEKKKLENQLNQAQKMESIGTLAGGIAHDFNNILSAIIGYTELAVEDITDPERARNELKEVLKAGDRAKNLVGQILTFSRKTETAYSPIPIRTILKESLKMLRSVIPTTVEIRQDLADSGLVLSNPTQIHQIIMNLSTNAADAMDEAGGVLGVSLKRVGLDQNTADGLDVTPGTYLRLTVSDTGQGMPPEVMERIFEPYFTTKVLGRGTGLGLSVVHGIVKSHGGAIICRSVPKKGTTFEVYLPGIESEKKATEPSPKEPLPTGKERILFIDDEAALAGLAEKVLSKLGYTVVTKSSSSEALQLFRKDPDKYDLVITDMTMPGMTGDKLAQKFMEIRQDIPIILCSGYSEHITVEKAKKIGIREFVMKPLEMKGLAETIRKVLDGG